MIILGSFAWACGVCFYPRFYLFAFPSCLISPSLCDHLSSAFLYCILWLVCGSVFVCVCVCRRERERDRREGTTSRGNLRFFVSKVLCLLFVNYQRLTTWIDIFLFISISISFACRGKKQNSVMR